MSLIKCENVSFEYEGNTVLSDINFALEKGDYLWVLGDNGAGKSTLVKGLLQLKKPAAGEIIMSDGLRPREVGYLPQQSPIQRDFPATAGEVVMSGCLNSLAMRPFYCLKEKNMAKENMKRLEVFELADKSYSELSGGQQQRILIARALCSTKSLIILDEPASGLDPIVTKELYQIIDDINKNLGITIIMISHHVEMAVTQESKVLHINKKQLFFGTMDEYKKTTLGSEFLGGTGQ